MLRAIAIGLVAAALGCSSPAPGGDVDGGGGVVDAPPRDGGSNDVDVPPAGVGLEFDFAAPGLPAVATGVAIDEVRVWLRDVRVLGDAAPGDSRTSLAQLELDFEPGRSPPPVTFPQAPPGNYSQLAARLGRSDGSQSFEIEGTVTIAGVPHELEVRDRNSADVSIALDVRVDTQAVAVPVALDLSFLGGIDWSTAPQDGNGRVELENGGPIVDAVRAGIAAGFRAQ
jgi:hypothetical protein